MSGLPLAVYSKQFNLSSVDLDALQKRVLTLEEDNLGLRLEVNN